MNYLNSQQLAFILDIKKEDARAKMCVAWSAHLGEENKAERNKKNKIIDPYPQAMPVDVLSTYLNLPTLQEMVNDIVMNYLKRPATKKWILCDYPEKQLKNCVEAGRPKRIKFPPALKSMLPNEIQNQIRKEWKQRHSV